MRRYALVVALYPLLGADQCDDCVEAPPPEQNAGFAAPAKVTKANTRMGAEWQELGDADWSCLDTPSADLPSTQAIALTGVTEDFQSGDPFGGGEVTAFAGAMTTGNLGMALSSDAAATRGEYAMTVARLPAGETRVGFRVEGRDHVRTYRLGIYLDPAQAAQVLDLTAWSVSTVSALPAFIGRVNDITRAMVTGTMRDCAGHEVSNAIATVSAVSGTAAHLADLETYYFSAGFSASLPVRNQDAPATRGDGMFLVLDARPQTAPAFVQVWGFPTAAALEAGRLKLLGELATPLESDAVTDVSVAPRRTR